jgi:hypothetical protein
MHGRVMGLALSACAALLLGGCARPLQSAAPPATLAPLGAITPRSASQVLYAAFGARAVTLRTALELDAGSLRVVGVTATGQRLFTASWDGQRIEADRSPLVPGEVDPARVLADVQLALWPLAPVREAFRAAGLEVIEPFAGVRRVLRGGRLVAEVHYAGGDPWNGRLWLVNLEHDYSLTIDTRSGSTN